MTKPNEADPWYLKGVRYLDPHAIDVRSSSCGFLEVLLPDGRTRRARPVQVLPISAPGHYVVLLDESGEELGFIKNIHDLPREQRKMLVEALERAYFVPRIIRINDLSYRFHVLYFDVETDRGRRKFELSERTENLRLLSNGKAVVEDVDGNRYVIDDISALDPRSQALLDPHT